MSLPIREATDEESELIYQVMIESFKEYSGKLIPPSGALMETVDQTIQTFHNGGGAAIACDGDQLVGSARYERRADYMYIGRVSVLPAYRGKGIGKALIAYVENKARTQGLKETRLGVRLSIPENVKLYERLHYEIIEHGYYPEQTDSWYVMSKKL